jgi:hypothetical protein
MRILAAVAFAIGHDVDEATKEISRESVANENDRLCRQALSCLSTGPTINRTSFRQKRLVVVQPSARHDAAARWVPRRPIQDGGRERKPLRIDDAKQIRRQQPQPAYQRHSEKKFFFLFY